MAKRIRVTGTFEIGDIKNGREIGYTNRSKYIWCACEKCGRERWVHLMPKEVKPEYSHCWKCAQPSKVGKDSPRWKGGQYTDGHGYIRVHLQPDDPFRPMASNWGYVSKHRLIMAESLGRYLSSKEIVHHLNGIKEDNRPQNLIILHRGNHPHNTFVKECQKRIRKLEAQLAQHKLL